MCLLERLEAYFEAEPSSGIAWSFLDFLDEAYRINHGNRAVSFDELVKAAPAEMPIVASYGGLSGFDVRSFVIATLGAFLLLLLIRVLRGSSDDDD